MERSELDARRERLSPEKRRLLEQRLQGSAAPTIPPRPEDAASPLSAAQERIWFLSQLTPGSPTYNRPAAFRLTGRLDMPSLERAVRKVLRRHEVLRSAYPMQGEQPTQIILDDPPIPIPVENLEPLSPKERTARLQSMAARESQVPFDLARGPLVRARLFRLEEQSHVLLFVFHHIVFDAWSAGILRRELAALHDGFVRGEPSSLQDPPIQYGDFAYWQRNRDEPESTEESLRHFTSALQGVAPTLDLPSDRSRPPIASGRGGTEFRTLEADLVRELRELGRGEEATLFMTLISAFFTLLHRYTGLEKLVLGCPTAGRTTVETEESIGLYVNSFVLSADLSGGPAFRDLLRQVRASAIEGMAHRELPFEKLVERLNPERDMSRTPVFQVMFNLENLPSSSGGETSLLVEEIEVDSGIAPFDLTLEILPRGDSLRCEFNYNSDLYDAASIRRMSEQFVALLHGIVRDPDQPIDRLPLLDSAERERLLVEWSRGDVEYPDASTVHQEFEAQADRTPDATALLQGSERMTYRELNRRANQLAHHLRERGAKDGSHVAICMDRSFDLVVGLLGILKAGCAYVPIDPRDPKHRIRTIIEDAEASLLLCREPLPGANVEVLCLESNRSPFTSGNTDNPPVSATPDSTAYIIYTSGSTGTPKGVAVPHRAVLRLLFGLPDVRMDAEETVLHLSSIAFDASTFAVWSPLLHGGRLVPFGDALPSPASIGAAIRENRVTTLWLTGSLFNVLIHELPEALTPLRQLLIGGEALSVPHVRKAVRLLSGTRIFNGYGPTETTVFAATYRIPAVLPERLRSIPIGRPIGNTRIYILDSRHQPVPAGVPGELCIAGPGLARGYLNHPELTAERFPPDPFREGSGERMYRTGDRARFLPDGNIEYLGRMDRQVKVRGFRIELGEIEAALKNHPAVQDAAVAVREDRPGESRLVAYCVPDGDFSPERSELQDALARTLPGHMVPGSYVFLDALPLNASGKVDPVGLPAPTADHRVNRETVEPANATERKLVRIWQKILGVPSIGVTDDFFELGGHSLLAARLFVRIERVFGRELPVASIFEAPTVRKLAALLGEDVEAREWSSLIAIKPDGSRAPFFCVAHGDVVGLEVLGRHMDPDIPFYGLQAPGLDKRPPSYSTLEDLATVYLRDLRNLRPEGPYLLGGRCIGAIVAMEMAKRLLEDGEAVPLLAVLDTIVPPTNFARGLDHAALAKREAKTPRARIRLKKTRKRLIRLFDAQERKAERIRQTMYAARRRYLTESYTGPLTLFQTEKSGRRQRLQSQWKEATTGPFEIVPVQGTHGSMWYEPWVQDTGKKLSRCIDEVLARNGS